MEEYIRSLKEKGVKYAVFDVDGTLSYTNTVYAYVFCMKKRINNNFLYSLWYTMFLMTAPFWMIIDWIDRDIFQRYL